MTTGGGILLGKVVGYHENREDSGRTRQFDVATCCHCQMVFEMEKGSGVKRGYCLKCAKLTCGRPCCDPCVPFEQWLANVEAGKPADFRPIMVSASG